MNTVTTTVTNTVTTTTGATTMTNNINVPKVQVMKNEIMCAEAMVPAIFGDMFLKEYALENPIIERQIMAASIFKALYKNLEAEFDIEWLMDEVYYHFETMKVNNRKAAINLQWIDLPDVKEFIENSSYICIDNDTDVMTVSDSFKASIYKTEVRPPMSASEFERRVFEVKGNKVKPSNLAYNFLDITQGTQFSIDLMMFEAISIVAPKLPKLAIWKDARTTLDGCALMDSTVAYVSEWDFDYRGRSYFASYYGVNPQGDDLNRSLYTLSNKHCITIDSYGYQYLLKELNDTVKNPKMLEMESIMFTGANPAKVLYALLKREEAGKIFSYVRMCIDVYICNRDGYVMSGIVAGPDAKCSGPQIYSIVTGNMSLMAACGFSDKNNKPADAYKLATTGVPQYQLERDDIKKSFMAIIYGGGIQAVSKSTDMVAKCVAISGDDDDVVIKNVIAAVENVLGEDIMSFRKNVAAHVATKLKESNKTHLKYTHIDGFVVNKSACPKVIVTGEFSEMLYTRMDKISFGSAVKNTGLEVSTGVPCADEFARKFMVNWVQGIDALVARTVARNCALKGIKDFVSVHDCFRVGLGNVELLQEAIKEAYVEIFIDNDVVEHLCNEIGMENPCYNKVITKEMIYSEVAYYFE